MTPATAKETLAVMDRLSSTDFSRTPQLLPMAIAATINYYQSSPLQACTLQDQNHNCHQHTKPMRFHRGEQRLLRQTAAAPTTAIPDHKHNDSRKVTPKLQSTKALCHCCKASVEHPAGMFQGNCLPSGSSSSKSFGNSTSGRGSTENSSPHVHFHAYQPVHKF